MKALIATPLYDGRAEREFVNGLLQCHGLYYAWACIEGQANISLARDTLAAQFLASDCTTLVFIDGDIGFGRNDLQTLLSTPQSLVGGLYPRKRAQMDWVFDPLEDAVDAALAGNRPFKVRHIGAGFLKIERRVFTDLIAQGCPSYPGADGRAAHHFFASGVIDGQFLSEDYHFCESAARVGHSVHADPRIRLRHVGRRVFEHTTV